MGQIQVTKEIVIIMITVIFLAANSLMDICKKKISLLLVSVYILTWIFLLVPELVREGLLFNRLISGLLPGVLLCAIGIVSRGALGLGDGILVMPVGLYLGIKTTGIMVICAFFLAFIWGILLLCFGRRKKEYAFPFAPFLFIGLFLALFL